MDPFHSRGPVPAWPPGVSSLDSKSLDSKSDDAQETHRATAQEVPRPLSDWQVENLGAQAAHTTTAVETKGSPAAQSLPPWQVSLSRLAATPGLSRQTWVEGCEAACATLGGVHMAPASRTALLAFLRALPGQVSREHFRAAAQTLFAGCFHSGDSHTTAVQRVPDTEPHWAQRRVAMADALAALAVSEPPALEGENLAIAVTALADAIHLSPVILREQRQALRAAMVVAFSTWEPERARAAGVGLGSALRADPAWAMRGAMERVSAVAGAKAGAPHLLCGLRAGQALAHVLDAPALEPGQRAQLLDWCLAANPRIPDEPAALLAALAAKTWPTALVSHLSLALVARLEPPPGPALFRQARDLLLAPLGDPAAVADPALTWPQWQAQAQAALLGEPGGVRESKGPAHEASKDEAGRSSASSSASAQQVAAPIGHWRDPARVEAVQQASALYEVHEGRWRALGADGRPGVPLTRQRAFIEEEIPQLIRMAGIAVAVRQLLVERLSVWGTELDPTAHHGGPRT